MLYGESQVDFSRDVESGCITHVGWTAAALWIVASTAAVAASDAQTLLHTYRCYVCHDDDTWKAGPAFRDVADRYRASRRSASAMVLVIRQGQHGGGPWHMPPHPEVGAAQARVMADYILSLR